MLEGIYLLLFIGLIASFLDLKFGMYFILVGGCLQDPLRKLVPDSPVYLSAVVMLFAAFTFIGARGLGKLLTFRSIPGWNLSLKSPIELFVLIVILQSFMTVVKTGSVVLAGIGLLVYLAPFLALLLAYSFASGISRIYGFLWVYIALTAAMVSGVYFSWLGFDWEILGSVGDPLIVYSLATGEPLILPAGFFRQPEMAAWHAGAGACIALMLGLFSGRRDRGLICAALVVFFVGAVLLSGRRKFLLEIAVFLPALWWLLWRFKMATRRVVYVLWVVATISIVAIATGMLDSNSREAFEAPATRGQEGWTEVIDRYLNATINAIPYIIQQNGILGSGAGSGSGGAQYYGGGDDLVGSAAEGGLGKILAELGVPGMFLFIWLGFRLLVYVWHTLAFEGNGDSEVRKIIMGMAAFLVANAFVFAGAHQVYSDPYILLVLGISFGFVLAARRLQGEGSMTEAFSVRQAASSLLSSKPRIFGS